MSLINENASIKELRAILTKAVNKEVDLDANQFKALQMLISSHFREENINLRTKADFYNKNNDLESMQI